MYVCIHVYNCTGTQAHMYTCTHSTNRAREAQAHDKDLPRHQKRTKRKNRGNSYLIVKLLTNYCK